MAASSRVVSSRARALGVLRMGSRLPLQRTGLVTTDAEGCWTAYARGSVASRGQRHLGSPGPGLAPNWCLLKWEDGEGRQGELGEQGSGTCCSLRSSFLIPSLYSSQETSAWLGQAPPLGSLMAAQAPLLGSPTLAYSPLPGPPHSSLDPSRLSPLGMDFELWEGRPGAISVPVVPPGFPVRGFGPEEFLV